MCRAKRDFMRSRKWQLLTGITQLFRVVGGTGNFVQRRGGSGADAVRVRCCRLKNGGRGVGRKIVDVLLWIGDNVRAVDAESVK